MPMSLRLAISLALLTAAPAVLADAPATVATTAQAAVAAAPAAKGPAWVSRSDAITTQLLKDQAKLAPEGASGAGLTEFDGLASDYGPNIAERSIAQSQKQLAGLKAKLATEKDAQVRQDIEILIGSVEDDVTGTRLNQKYQLPWLDVPQFVFGNIQSLLDDQIPEARRGKALELLQRYTGVYKGSVPVAEQGKARY